MVRYYILYITEILESVSSWIHVSTYTPSVGDVLYFNVWNSKDYIIIMTNIINILQCCSLILINRWENQEKIHQLQEVCGIDEQANLSQEFGCGYGPCELCFVWEGTGSLLMAHRFRSPFSSLLQEARHLLEASQWNVEDRVIWNQCQTPKCAADSCRVGPLACGIFSRNRCAVAVHL